MRTRERSKLLVRTGTFHQIYTCEAGGSYDEPYYSDRVDGSYELMTDAGSAKTDVIRTRFLEHQRSDIQSLPVYKQYAHRVYTAKCPSPRYTGSFTMSGYLGPGYYIRGNPWILDPDEIEQNCYDAFRYFESGCVEQETLLANFAWELPDVKRLWPTFTDFLKLAIPGSTKKVSRSKEAKRTSKTIAGTYLGYQFGAAPLIGDLIRVYDQLTGLAKHISWLRENSGKIVKVEYRSSLKRQTLTTALPYLPTVPTEGYWRNIPEVRSGFKAWALMTYDVGGLSDLLLSVNSLIRAFGLNNPAAIVWEAMPYSFVLDWVSNVGKLLSRLEIPVKLPYVFHDCGYGVWTDSTIEDMYTSNGHTVRIRVTKTRGYGRRSGLPITLSKLSPETPSAKQLALGLALAVQKF